MLSAYALGRLIWRPASLLMLFPIVVFVAIISLATSPAELDSWRAFGRGEGLFHSLWGGANLSLALVGLMSTVYTSELRRGLFAWMLPGIDEHLLRGLILLELIFSLPFAAAFTILLGPGFGIAALGSGLLFFACGIEVSNSLRGRGYRWALVAAIAVAVFSPNDWHRIATISPIAFGVLTGTAGAILLRSSTARAMARQQPFVVDVAFGFSGAEALRAYWAGGRAYARQWQRALRHGTSRDWVAAAVYESYNPRVGGWGRHVLVQAAVGSLIFYAINAPSLVAVSAGSDFIFVGLQLRMNAIYPISRQQRARVFYIASLVENVVISGLYALLIWLLYSFGPGHLKFLAGDEYFSPASAAAFVAFVFMLAPVAQWARVGEPHRYVSFTQPRRMWKRYVWLVAFMLLVTTVSIPLRYGNAESWLPWSTIPIAAIIIQALYWLALQRHFSRADLA